MLDDTRPFWETKRLDDMSREEWESLCDGCGRCCLHKLENFETGEIFPTKVACRYLDPETSRCGAYAQRFELVDDCIQLTPRRVRKFKWLPKTCAYRRLAEGKSLPEWHPLITGDPGSVHRAGISVRGKTISEDEMASPYLEDYITDEDL